MKKIKIGNPFKHSLVIAFSCLVLIACDQGEERLKEKADLEGAISARKQIEAEKEYLKERSEEMEADLARRQRFYSGVAGTYDGVMKGSNDFDDLKVRFIFAPSLPPYPSQRLRALDEIVADLNNLHFNVQVTQWTSDNRGADGVAFGCVFENVRPDLSTGKIYLASSDCPSLYLIALADDSKVPPRNSVGYELDISSRIAGSLLEATGDRVNHIKGMRQVTKSSTIFSLVVSRTP